MGFDKVKIKQICFLILYVAVIVLLLIYSNVLFAGLGMGIKIVMPFLIGGAIAFILNIPMNAIEKKLFKKWQGRTAKAKRPISLVMSIIFVVAILALVVVAVVPQVRTTIETLGNKIELFWPKLIVWLEGLATDYPELAEQIAKIEEYDFDWGTITSGIGSFLSNGVTNVISSTVSVATSIVGGIANVFIAIVFAIYILVQKERLAGQGSRILDAYVKGKANGRIRDVLHRLHVNFTNFICGQCLEAVILGLLFVIFMSIFQMPYAVMIGTLIAFTALIPIVGAFIGCGVGAFMILIDNPVQALWFVILFLILQQLEGNLIYPRVVGNSVGLPSIWVLMSVSVGGSLFGVVGMLVFIPLMSTLYSLLRDDVNQRNLGKHRNRAHGGKANVAKVPKGQNDAKVQKQQKVSKAQKIQKEEAAEEFTSAQIVERLVAEQEVKVKQELDDKGLVDVSLQKDTKTASAEQKPQNKKKYKKHYYYNNKKQQTKE